MMVVVKWGDSRQLDEGSREAVERGTVDGEGAEQISQEATQLTPVLLLRTTAEEDVFRVRTHLVI